MFFFLIRTSSNWKAHVHPNGFAPLCFCFETLLLSNAVFWLASTFEERCVTILKTTSWETSFFRGWPKLKETVSKRPVRLFSFLNGRRYIWPTSLNVFGESSSRFKLVLNAYGCFIESDEHNEGHKITKRLSTRWDFLEARFDCEMFDSSIYYFVTILRKVRYVFSKEWARSCVCKASNQHFVQACRCNRCVTLRVPYDRVYSWKEL